MQPNKEVEFILNASVVKRWHNADLLKENTVAHHSWGVAMFCYLLMEGNPSLSLIMAALVHDMAEQEIGDIPGPTKHALKLRERLDELERGILANAGLDFELTAWEQHILTLADWADGMMCCVREARLGNKNLDDCFKWWQGKVQKEIEEHGSNKHEIFIFEQLTALYGMRGVHPCSIQEGA